MNLSFVAIGLTMAAGAVLARPAFAPGVRRAVAVGLFAIAGAGVIAVGLFPENEQNDWHTLGAALNFAAGNLALILFGLSWKAARADAGALAGRPFTLFSTLLGMVGLIAAGTLAAEAWGSLGVGTVERLAAYPQPIWQMCAGLAIWGRTSGTIRADV
jgi:hypothetical membrane protein